MWNRLCNFFQHDLWRHEPDVGYRRWLHPALRVLVVMAQELAGGELSLRAMSLVYLTLLSLVPLLAVSFSVLKAFGVHNQLEPVLLTYLEPLGPQGADLAHHIVAFVRNLKVGVLGSVGLAMLLYTVVSLTQKVESAFNRVWGVTRLRSLSRRFTDYLSVILVGPVLAFTAIGVTASMSSSRIVQGLRDIPGAGVVIIALGKVLPFLLIIAAFTFVYMFMPNTKVKPRSALTGAVVCGILWEGSGMLFTAFVVGSGRYAAVYSGFAILMLFMIWMYLSWFILLFGARISYYHQYPHQLRPERGALQLSWRQRERAGLALLALIAQAHYRGEPLWSRDRLARRLGLPGDVVDALLRPLLQHHMLVEGGDDGITYLPACDPTRILISDVLELLRSAEESSFPVALGSADLAPVNLLVDNLQQARHQALEGITLRQLGDM